MKTVGLKIEIDGLSDITKEVVKLEGELKDLNTQLKAAEVGSDAYIDLRNQIAATTEQLKAAKKEQRDFVKEATATKEAEGSYYALNKQLVDLKKQYKSLSQAERESDVGKNLQKQIQALDKELKDIDASIGQFQRNVGNYPKGIGRLVKGLEQVVPGFEQFSKSLQNAEGKLNIFGKALVGGFVAFQAAKLIGQAVKALDEFVSKINETRETVAEFSGAYGEDLDSITADTTALANTFNTDAKTISEAAQALSQQLGIGFEEALGKLEGALVEGRGNAGDYLKTIAEYPEAFQEAGNGVTEFSERNRQLLDTNKELAASQVDVAKRLTGFTDGIKQVGSQITTVLLAALANVIDFLRPIAETIGKTVRLFFDFAAAIGKTVSELPGISALFGVLKDGAAAVSGFFENLPFIFEGVVAGIKQLGVNFVNFFKVLALDAQIFGEQIKEFFGANADAAIEELRRRRAAITDEGRTVAQAFSEAFNKAKADADKRAAEEERKNLQIEAQKAAAARKAISSKELADRAKEQRDAAKKLAEERKKYAEQEAQEARTRAALLADLQAKLIEETIKNVTDARTREIQEVENAFAAQVAAYQKGYEKLILEGQQREKELAEIFGKNSTEVIQAREKLQADLIAIQAKQNEIIAQLEAQKNTQLAAINEQYRQAELQKAQDLADQLKQYRDEALSNEISYIQEVGDARIQAAQEQLNRALIAETDAKKREQLIRLAAEQETADKIATLRNQLRAVEDQEEFLKSQAAAGVQIKQDEYAAVLKARQELNTELSALELEQTERVRQEAQRQRDIRLQQIEQVVGYVEQGLQFVDGFIDAANEREANRVAEQQEQNEARQAKLQSDLENATGLRKKFLEQQLALETQNAERLAKEQERIQRNAAKADKAIAVTQSIIQGFLAVSRAIASAPPPFNIPAITAASVQSAIQTGLILAQPLAEGGAVQPVVLPDSGGKLVAAQNIPTTGKGDNVLVAARVGETFLNAKQTALLRPALSAARVPGFATGGLIGGVPTTPNLSGITGGNVEAIRAFNERTEAIKEQVLKTRVVLVTDDLSRDNENKERIEKRARLE